MPCLPVAGINRASSPCRTIGAGVWVEFEHGDPDYPIWVGGYWGTRGRGAGARARRAARRSPASRIQTTLKNGIVISDVPGPDRRHPDPDDDRRDDLGQRRRHHHLERQGRDHHHDRPDRRRQRRRADGDLRTPCPAPILHLGATVLCTHAARRRRSRPFPRVLVSGQPVVTLASPYAVAGCALTGTPTPPCVTAQWIVGATRVLAGGVPVALHDRHVDLRRRPARRCCRSSAQTRVLAT